MLSRAPYSVSRYLNCGKFKLFCIVHIFVPFLLVEGQQEVIVKNCLQTGKTEYLGLSLNQSFPNTDCGVWVIETYVEPKVIF